MLQGGRSTSSEYSQGVYERLLEKLQTLKILRTYTFSGSTWLKAHLLGHLRVISGTFGVLPWALSGWWRKHSFLILSGGLWEADNKIQTLKIFRTSTVSASIWLKSSFFSLFAVPQHTFWYSLGPPMGPAGVGGRSIPSESTQGVYDRLSKQIQKKHSQCVNMAQNLGF